MKFKILGVLLLLFTSSIYAQTQAEYKKVAKNNQINYVPSSIEKLRDSTFSKYLVDINNLSSKKIFNNTVLNKYFTDKITNYATSTDDFSYKNYFINANTSEKTLTIGRSFRLDNFGGSQGNRKARKQMNSLRKMGNIFTLYFKSNLSNGFSNLYSEDSQTQEYNFNNNIGVGGKYTHVFNGSVTTYDSQKVKDLREDFIKDEITKMIADYDDDKFNKDVELEKLKSSDSNAEIKKKIVRKKHREFYEAITDMELEYAKEYDLIRKSSVIWTSFEFYIPLVGKDILSSSDNVVINTDRFRNWKTAVNFNYLRNGKTLNFPVLKEISMKFTAELSVYNTNTFIENNVSPVTFQNIIQDNMTNQVEGTSSQVFRGSFDDFTATSYKSELVFLLFDNIVGLSGALERITGDIYNTNWKLGIPFSLKDKDDKPTVNFELQWREISGQHSVGISVGYNFGKFVQ